MNEAPKIRFNCPQPGCGHRLKGSVDTVGRPVRCPKCQCVVMVPSADGNAALPTATAAAVTAPLTDRTTDEQASSLDFIASHHTGHWKQDNGDSRIAQDWYWRSSAGEVSGPFFESAINERIAAGKMLPNDLVCRAQWNAWRFVSDYSHRARTEGHADMNSEATNMKAASAESASKAQVGNKSRPLLIAALAIAVLLGVSGAASFGCLGISRIFFWPTAATKYVPLAKGQKWRYELSVGGKSIASVMVENLEPSNFKGKEVARQKTETLGKTEISFLREEDDGICEVAKQDDDASTPTPHPPVYLLKKPLEVGTTWKEEYRHEHKELFSSITKEIVIPMTATIIDTNSSVTVRGRKFENCILTESSATYEEPTLLGAVTAVVTRRTWYAPKVGMVKLTVNEKKKGEELEISVELDWCSHTDLPGKTE